MTLFQKKLGIGTIMALIFLTIAVFLGTLARWQNLFHLGFVFDTVTTQFEWGRAAWQLNVFEFYRSYPGWFDYVPGNLLFLAGVYGVASVFGGSMHTFVVVLKSAAWLVEIALALIIFAIGKKRVGQARALVASGLAYLTPSLWFVSGVWGQNDTLAIMLALASVLAAWKARQADAITVARTWAVAAGLIFAAALWFKLQAILMLPIIGLLLLVHFQWKDAWKILVAAMAFAAISLIGFYVYTQNLYDQSRLAVSFGMSIFSVSVVLITARKWVSTLAWWFVSSMLVGVTSVAVVFAALDLGKFSQGFFAPFTRQNVFSNGALNLWSIFQPISNDASTPIARLGSVDISVSWVSLAVYALSAFVFVRALFRRHNLRLIPSSVPQFLQLPQLFAQIRWRLFDVIFAVYFLCGMYFFFFTKMHSRYLHFTVITSLILLAIHKKMWKSISAWLGMIALHLGYFFNQVGVYEASNQPQTWMLQLRASLPFDYFAFAGAIMLLGFGILTMDLWKELRNPEAAEVV